MGQRGLHAPPAAEQGDVQGVLDHLVGLVLHQDVGAHVGGVVDQDIQPAEFIHGALHHGFHFSLDADVGGNTDSFCANFVADLFGYCFGGLAIAAGDQQFCPVFRQAPGNAVAETLGATGDDGHFTF